MTGDAELMRLAASARDGNAKAWARIYESMAPSIFRLCRRMLRNRQDAEDATAEVFLKARLRLANYDGERALEPWLYKIAANHCCDELRKRNRPGEQGFPDHELRDLADPAPTPQDAVIVRESKRNVRRALGELSDRSRIAVVLRYYAELSYEEIGDVLGISKNLVGVLLLRARHSMRKVLDR